MSWSKKYDEKVAKSIYHQLNITGITENAVFPKEKGTENYRPKTLIDETLEYIDPTPNIFTLFVQFNEKFFWNVLLPVQVKWSPRMTSCAGICSFHPRNRECVISLSTPLLKLRPRKDLIETLLHEMIHAYLFLTNDNRDRDGHGPVFQSHMKRINKEAGTNITIYHSFHEEVKLYQQHWWRCNGPCQKRAPYFGTVKRAMNRAPGPNDFWWTEHQATCGGQFIKIREPEKPEPKKKGRASTGSASKPPEKNGLTNWLKKTDNGSGSSQGNSIVPKKSQPPQSSSFSSLVPTKAQPIQAPSYNNTKTNSVSTDLKKLGNSTNNVHGWGTAGPTGTTDSSWGKPLINNKTSSTISTQNTGSSLSFSGTLGGSNTGRSNLLDKFSNSGSSNKPLSNGSKNQSGSFAGKTNSVTKPLNSINLNNITKNLIVKTVNCPVCNKSVEEVKINEHIDSCLLQSTEDSTSAADNSSKKRKSETNYPAPNKLSKTESQSSSSQLPCPLCQKKMYPDKLNEHLSKCVESNFDEKEDDVVSLHDSSSSSVNLQDSPHHCLICDKPLDPNISLNEHLEECVASVFNDTYEEDNDNDIKLSEPKTKVKLEKYPCPICMNLFEESVMNKHLNTCLADSK